MKTLALLLTIVTAMALSSCGSCPLAIHKQDCCSSSSASCCAKKDASCCAAKKTTACQTCSH